MTSFILVSRATIYSHFLRTVKDFSLRTLTSRTEKVVNNEEYCLFSVMLEFWGASWWSNWTQKEPSCLCPMCLWTFLLGHTTNLCCFQRTPPKWRLCRLKGGLKSVIGLTWRNMTYCAHHEWSGFLFRDEAGCIFWLQHSLPNQTMTTMELCHRHRLVLQKAKSQFCITFLFPFFSIIALLWQSFP